MARLYANNAESTLAGNIGAGATSFSVATGEGSKFPSPSGGDYFNVTLEQGTTIEVMKCTARSGDVLTVTRAEEDVAGVTATAYAFTDGAIVSLRTTADSFVGTGNEFSCGLRNASAGVYLPLLTTYTLSIGSQTRTLNQLNVYPFIVAETMTLDRLGNWCVTPDASNASAVFRYGLWNHDAANERPGTLIVDGGTVSAFSGVARFLEVTINTTLQPGIYWAGAVAQGSANTATATGFQQSTMQMVPIRRTAAPASATLNSISGLIYNSVTGALADITTAPTDQSGNIVMLYARHA